MRRIETDSEILQKCNETDSAARVVERNQTSQRVLWQFSQKSFIMSQIPRPGESRVTKQPPLPCTLYNVRAVFMMALLLQ